ncbi:MAG: ABC transporter ATP-binding protein, partial [Lachnospiraceae bacterium]|nr:ABC transporter ATP-binding protein [Lachnospiraceae bacterium]
MKRKGTLKKIIRYTRKYTGFLILSIPFALLTVLSTLYVPILTGKAVDTIIGVSKVDFPALFAILRQIGAVIIVTALAQWLQNLCNNHLTYCIAGDIREEAYRKIGSLPLSYLDAHPHGDIVSRMTADVDQLADGLLMGFTQLFTGVLTVIGTLIYMFSVSAPITAVVIVLTPLSMLAARFIARYSYRMFRKQSETRGKETALINEVIAGEKVVQSFGREKVMEERFRALNEELGTYSRKAVFASSLTNPVTRFVNNLVYASVAVFGAMLVIGSGGFTAGMLTAFLSYASQYTKPFNEISGVIAELQNAMACAARVFELIEEKEEEPDPLDAKEIAEPEGSVRFSDVSFSYDKKQPLIRDLNLNLRPGQTVAIVGPTGSGKTTMINLLMRFYDVDEGDICIDGESICRMKKQYLRKCLGMVLQETWLKSGSIRENIAFGNPNATDEEIVRAAKEAHADSFIRRLPEGYDTVLTEEGGSLSEGQKQLLCIARVMLSLPPMLILDEATSSIDTRTELKIQDAFSRMMAGRTSFVVAHRLSTIRSADIILVMKDGQIIEQGKH